jgi:hypothetical protein
MGMRVHTCCLCACALLAMGALGTVTAPGVVSQEGPVVDAIRGWGAKPKRQGFRPSPGSGGSGSGGSSGKGGSAAVLDVLVFIGTLVAEQLGLPAADRRFRSAVAPFAPTLAETGVAGTLLVSIITFALAMVALRRVVIWCKRYARARLSSIALARAVGVNGLELEPVYNDLVRPASPEALAMVDTFTATPAELPGPSADAAEPSRRTKGKEGKEEEGTADALLSATAEAECGCAAATHAGLQREAELAQMDRKELIAEILRLDRQIEAADTMPSCAVCVEPLKVGQRLSRLTCGHMFHARCLHMWLRQADSCPNCRFALRCQDGGGGGTNVAST